MTDTDGQPALLDTHQHLVYPERFGYGWTDDIAALQARAFTLHDYRNEAGSDSIGRALFMETGVDDEHWREETRFALALAAEPGNQIAGVVAGCRPERSADEFDTWLDELAGTCVVGCRRILHTEADTLSASDLFARNVRQLGKRGLTFDLCFLERQLPRAVSLAKRCSDTQLVLDHCGVPDIGNGDFAAWQDGIRQLAALPNVACKLSGLVAYCAADRDTAKAILPYLEYCAEMFGEDRLVWGSDWPVCNVTVGMSPWITIFRDFIAATSPDTQDALCRTNAVRIYNIRD